MVDKRFEQGFTIYQTNLRSDALMGGDAKYWKGKNVPHVEFYQNELDRRMYSLADKGIVNALGFAWFMSIENNIEQEKNLARYIIARYGALPMVWTLAGEVGGYDKSIQKYYVDGWREVALYVQNKDGYNHLQTAHYTNERPFASYYQDEEWFDFTLNQAGHGDFVVSANDYKEFMAKHNDKPFVEGEVFYEFCSTLEENGSRLCDASMGRRCAYISIQSGGCGFTYGAQGIWDTYYEKGEPNGMSLFNKFGITWYEAIEGEGAQQMAYMKDFYLKEKFWELYPYHAGNDNIGNPFGKKLPLVTVSKDASHWILYYPASTRKTEILKGFNSTTYEMTWFNPRNNHYLESTVFTVENNEWNIPNKPDKEDWLLIVKER